jgi:ribosomal protein S18 acetylase RimI-like enzyme
MKNIIRSFTPSDWPFYVDSILSSLEREKGDEKTLSGMLALKMKRPGYDPGRDLFVFETKDRPVFFLDVQLERLIRRAVMRLSFLRCGDAPDFPEALLNEGIRRAEGELCSTFHVCLEKGRESGLVLFFTNCGFKEVRRFADMSLTLDAFSFDSAMSTTAVIDSLKPGEEKDLARLQNLVFNGSWGFCPNTEEDIRYFLKLTGCRISDVLSLCYKGRLSGYFWPSLNPAAFLDPETYGARIHMTGVLPELRGRGWGRTLLLAGLSMLKRRGINEVVLTVDTKNRSALSLYRSLGFREAAQKTWYEKKFPG